MDTLARGLLNTEALLADGTLDRFVAERYAGWDGEEGRAILQGSRSLANLRDRVARDSLEPQPRSGRQEQLENLVGRFM